MGRFAQEFIAFFNNLQICITIVFNNNNNKSNFTQPFDKYLQQKDTISTRISFIKANRIFTNNSNKIKQILANMVKNDIHIFGIAERNTHWNNWNIFRSSLTMILKKSWKTTEHTYQHQTQQSNWIRNTNQAPQQ